MNHFPLISCVIPTFNRAEKILHAVESVLVQTYPNIEILIVDDQSTDSTRETVRRLTENDKRVSYFFNPLKGTNNARNFGIINAAGDFIAMLDDDDEWLPTKLEKQMNCLLAHPDTALVFTAFKRKNGSWHVSRHPSQFSVIKNDKIAERLLKQNFITTSSILVRKKVLQETGPFDPAFKSFQDWELITRIALRHRLFYLNETLVIQYESRNSITRDKKGRIISSIRHLKKFRDAYQERPKILAYRYAYLGMSLIKQKKYLFASYLFSKSIKLNLLNLKALWGLLYLRLRKAT